MQKCSFPLVWKSVLLAAALEIPVAIWFTRVQTQIHNMAALLLGLFHLPSMLMMMLFLRPFKPHLSDAMIGSIGMTGTFVLQGFLIGLVTFSILLWRERRRV